MRALIVIFSLFISAFDYFGGTGFLEKFMEEQSLSIMAIILALYIPTANSLINVMADYERECQETLFYDHSRNIRKATYVVIGFFILQLSLLTFTPEPTTENIAIVYVLLMFKTTIFLMSIYLFQNLAEELFSVRSIINQDRQERLKAKNKDS